MPWKRPDEANSNHDQPAATSGGSNASADALFMLNALLSATTNATPSKEAASSSADPSANLSSLLDSLADFSARVNTMPDGDDGNGHPDHGEESGHEGTKSSTSADVASLLLSTIANATAGAEPTTVDEYDRYEREREQKFRELEAKFSFLTPKKVTKKVQQPAAPAAHRPAQRTVTENQIAASVKGMLASSVMTEFLSTLQKTRMGNNAPTASFPTNKPQKPSSHKRRYSSSDSSSGSSSYSSSSTDSDRGAKSKRTKADRKKKVKKPKSKKAKQKDGKHSVANKESKLKKDQASEKKTISQNIAKLKAAVAGNDKHRRTLGDELTRLRKQHNEMCRKLQRQKSDPKKDPLIVDNEALQCDIEKHLKELEKQKENEEKTLVTEEKRLEKLKETPKVTKKEGDKGPSKRPAVPPQNSSPLKKPKAENVHYFDPGSHWCKQCNTVMANLYEWLDHMHSQKHIANMDLLERPWMPENANVPVKNEGAASLKPFKGVEFLMPSTAFYCTLCKEFSGDSFCAEVHLKGEAHNAKYQAYVEANPFYERREMLEKAAAVSHRFERNSTKPTENVEDKKYHRPSSDSSGRPALRPPEPPRVPYKPNESGKIKPFRLSASASSSNDVTRPASSTFPPVAEAKKPASTVPVLKKPHSAFVDDDLSKPREESDKKPNYDRGDKFKYGKSGYYDRKYASHSIRGRHYHR